MKRAYSSTVPVIGSVIGSMEKKAMGENFRDDSTVSSEICGQ
jgi:hypothetical protein